MIDKAKQSYVFSRYRMLDKIKQDTFKLKSLVSN